MKTGGGVGGCVYDWTTLKKKQFGAIGINGFSPH